MATSYELQSIHIDTSTGISKVSVNVKVTDSLTNVGAGLNRTIAALPGPAQTRVDGLVADAISYINAQYPGVTVTMPSGS